MRRIDNNPKYTFLYRCGGNSIHKFNMLAIQVPILRRGEEEAIGSIARRELRSARSAKFKNHFAPPTQVQNSSRFIVKDTFEPTLPNLNIP